MYYYVTAIFRVDPIKCRWMIATFRGALGNFTSISTQFTSLCIWAVDSIFDSKGTRIKQREFLQDSIDSWGTFCETQQSRPCISRVKSVGIAHNIHDIAGQEWASMLLASWDCSMDCQGLLFSVLHVNLLVDEYFAHALPNHQVVYYYEWHVIVVPMPLICSLTKLLFFFQQDHQCLRRFPCWIGVWKNMAFITPLLDWSSFNPRFPAKCAARKSTEIFVVKLPTSDGGCRQSLRYTACLGVKSQASSSYVFDIRLSSWYIHHKQLALSCASI